MDHLGAVVGLSQADRGVNWSVK